MDSHLKLYKWLLISWIIMASSEGDAFIRSAWPDGPYWLPMSVGGCPESKAQGWSQAYINFTFNSPLTDVTYLQRCFNESLHMNPLSDRADVNYEHILGPFGDFSIQMNFCYKSAGTSYNNTWPDVAFAVYGSENKCSIGFEPRNVSLCFPQLWHWYADGELPYVEVESLTEESLTLTFLLDRGIVSFSYTDTKKKLCTCLRDVHFTYCTRYARSDAFPYQALEWKDSFMFLKDYETDCTELESHQRSLEVLPYQVLIRVQHNSATTITSLGYCYMRSRMPDHDKPNYDTTLQEALGGDCTRMVPNQMAVEIRECTPPPDNAAPHGAGISCNPIYWILIDHDSVLHLKALLVQKGTFSNSAYVRIYMSFIKWDFTHNGAKVCDYTIHEVAADTIVYRCSRSIEGKYVAVVTDAWSSMEPMLTSSQVQPVFCESSSPDVASTTRTIPCNMQLGMHERYIQDYQLTASSYTTDHSPSEARPKLRGWCADTNDSYPFIQIDLLTSTLIDGISIFNWHEEITDHSELVYRRIVVPLGSSAFHLEYGNDLNTMTRYSEQDFYVDVSRHPDEPRHFVFYKQVIARYIRIYPKPFSTSDTGPCLRFELYGCRKLGMHSFHCENNSLIEMLPVDETFVSAYNDQLRLINRSLAGCYNECTTQSCSAVEFTPSGDCVLYPVDHWQHYQKIRSSPDTDTVLAAKVCLNITSTDVFNPVWEDAVTGRKIVNQKFDSVISTAGVIASFGYPFYYNIGAVQRWTIMLGRSIKLLFADISLNSYEMYEDSENIALVSKCHDTIVASPYEEYVSLLWTRSRPGNVMVYIDNTYNGYMPTYYTRVDTLYMAFWTCSMETTCMSYGHGFRVLVSTDLPGCVYDVCVDQSAVLTSSSFRNLPVTIAEQQWQMGLMYPMSRIEIVFDYFDISCSNGGRFVIRYIVAGTDITYCNANKPVGARNIKTPIRFHFYMGYLSTSKPFTEGIKMQYRASGYKLNGGDIAYEETEVNAVHAACIKANGKCYQIYRQHFTWMEAASYCQSTRMFLVSFTSQDEHKLVEELLTFSDHLLTQRTVPIGLSRYDDQGIQREIWENGRPLITSNWDVNEPAQASKKTCTYLDVFTTKWQTAYCSVKPTGVDVFVICERFMENASGNQSGLLNTQKYSIDESEHLLETSMFYECSNNEQISILGRCNGALECSDASDELNCTNRDTHTVCGPHEFTCSDGTCIHISLVCNYVEECANAEDEFCEFPGRSGGQDEFNCNNGQYITLDQRCDAEQHCTDGSDEKNCQTCNMERAFQCADDTCIPKMLVCDNFEDCSDGDDEVACESRSYRTCDDVHNAGYTQDGRYTINDQLVECKFSKYTTSMAFLNTDWRETDSSDLMSAFDLMEPDMYILLPIDPVSYAVKNQYSCWYRVARALNPTLEDLNRMEHSSQPRDLLNYTYIKLGQVPWIESGDDFRLMMDPYRFVRGTVVVLLLSFNTDVYRLSIGPVICKKYGTNPMCMFFEYTCDSGDCINIMFLCNHMKDCPDGDDEFCDDKLSVVQCKADEFACDGDQCIPGDWECDGVYQCADGSDEHSECYGLCPDGYFGCRNGMCIPIEQVCDGHLNCYEAEDEICDFSCDNATEYACGDGKCISIDQRCDYVQHCDDNSDEHNCTLDATIGGMFPCGPGLQPISKAKVCIFDTIAYKEIIDGCRNMEHLQGCENVDCDEDHVKCPDSYCIPHKFVCDGKPQCPGGEDEDKCWCKHDSTNLVIFYSDTEASIERAAHRLGMQFYSPSRQTFVAWLTSTSTFYGYYIHYFRVNSHIEHTRLDYFTDSVLYTSGMEDISRILLKINIGASDGFIQIHNKAIETDIYETQFLSNIRSRVDVYTVLVDDNALYEVAIDVETGYITTHLDTLRSVGPRLFPSLCEETQSCENGYRCLFSRVCLPLRQVCDGTVQCPHGDDESLCQFTCPVDCQCEGYSIVCRHTSYNIFENASHTTRKLDISQTTGIGYVLDVPKRFSFLVDLNVSMCRIQSVVHSTFLLTPNLISLDLRYNLITTLPSGLFTNLVHLRDLYLYGNHMLQTLEPGCFDGLTVSSLLITGSLISRLTANIFSGLQLDKLDISNNSIAIIEDYAFNNLTAKHINMKGNRIRTFSSLIFSGVQSVNTLETPAYRFCCVRPTSVQEIDCTPHIDEFSSCEDLMRNLALRILLWVIGILALIGNVLSLLYRLVFDRERLKMGFGIFVTNLAIADLFMSVYLLIIAIADQTFRNRYIEMDVIWRSSVWCNLAGILSTMSSEGSVIFMSLITIDRLIVIKYPFGQLRISPKSATIASGCTWMVCLFLAILPLVYTDYFEDRFYTKSGVCLALPLTRDRPPGWLYSIFIFIGFNFVTFLLIALGQIMIYTEIKKQTSFKRNMQAARSNDLKVARNLLLLVTTDFLCWFPIGVIGIMALRGHLIPGEVYAWIAVLVLPFNSALNPFLYTFSSLIGRQNFNPRTAEQSGKEYSEEIGSAVMPLLQYWISRSWKKDVSSEILGDHISNRPMNASEKICVAWQLSKYVGCLHDNGLVTSKLNVHGISVTISSRGNFDGKVQVLDRPKLCRKANERKEGILQLGHIFKELLESNDKPQN